MFLSLIRQRRSIRQYLKKAVEPEKIEASIIAIGEKLSPHAKEELKYEKIFFNSYK